MTDAPPQRPQIYLVTPPDLSLSAFPPLLKRCLDRVEIACLRLSLATRDAEAVGRAADTLRAVTEPRDIALVIEEHLALVERHGLDGVHLTDGARSVRRARKALGPDAIVGAFCGASRHDGMNAGEAGADYVAFGPVGETGLGDGTRAPRELFEWWSEMIEVPVVAEGGLTADEIAAIAPVTDFVAIGPEIWGSEHPDESLAALAASLGEGG